MQSLLALFKEESSLSELIDIPVCDAEATFECTEDKQVSLHFQSLTYGKVVGIPSAPSLRAYLLEQCHALPDHDHNALAGIVHFEEILGRSTQPKR
jgi:hypothetical protein